MPSRITRHRPASLPVPRVSQYDVDRGSACSRGYDRRWRRYRAVYLRQHPLCVMCGEVATEVDHVVPVVDGQSDQNFWMDTNHQALCGRCHRGKTALERSSMGQQA